MIEVTELKELEINLRAQQFEKQSGLSKKFYLAGAYILPSASLAILLYDFSWITLFYFVMFSANAFLYYGIAKGKDPYQLIMGKSYLKVNAHLLETKKSFRKPMTIRWQNVKTLEVKLFAVEATLKTGEKAVTSLEELSDDNLKLVKQQLQEIKDLYQI